jgi:Na+-translocating ferredoxin:NAD+ oxidoreductase subunit D
MKRMKALTMGDAPFIFDKRTSGSLMWGSVLALLPALAWGLYCFGTPAAIVVASSILGALVGEAITSGLRRRFTLMDGSAFLTGLLVGMAMPPGVSPHIPALASLFAICVVKGAFGGLGSNWMNPALAGIAFAFVSWPTEMRSWCQPSLFSGVSGLSGATPLGMARNFLGSASPGSSPVDLLSAAGAGFSAIDGNVTGALNKCLFSFLGAELPSGYIDLLIGNKAGAVGEISAILILLGSIALIARRAVRWEIPASIVLAFAALTWTFGGLPLGNGFFAGDVLFSILTGSFLLVAFFMAPDPVTSPSSRPGMVVYGLGIGAIVFLLRSFGSAPEGSAFAVILMNCAVPAIDGLKNKARGRKTSRAAADPVAAAGSPSATAEGSLQNARR